VDIEGAEIVLELAQHADAEDGMNRLSFRIAFEQVVRRLHGDERRPAMPVGEGVGPGENPGGGVADAEGQHLPCAHRIVECAHGLLDRRTGIPDVHVVEVDVAGAQPP